MISFCANNSTDILSYYHDNKNITYMIITGDCYMVFCKKIHSIYPLVNQHDCGKSQMFNV